MPLWLSGTLSLVRVWLTRVLVICFSNRGYFYMCVSNYLSVCLSIKPSLGSSLFCRSVFFFSFSLSIYLYISIYLSLPLSLYRLITQALGRRDVVLRCHPVRLVHPGACHMATSSDHNTSPSHSLLSAPSLTLGQPRRSGAHLPTTRHV